MASDVEFARKLFAGPCEFVAGAVSLEALPESSLPEVAFIGRSNVGKSSLINALVGRTKLARVSQTPGRTRQINLFRLRDAIVLADLPGYGFARVSKTEAIAWNALISGYLVRRASLRRVVLLLDARRGVMESDREVMALLDRSAAAYRLVLTKSDLLKTAEIDGWVQNVTAEAAAHPAALAGVIATSSETAAGMENLRLDLAELAQSFQGGAVAGR
ncbi:MAG: YihA family ribosome biogenesis GTP-binding protein [Alphaproteobacteria bacterium]|nr:YihA family ribosome biogenesis GTP-binding protein [Alphaproteobacteria bacterium]